MFQGIYHVVRVVCLSLKHKICLGFAARYLLSYVTSWHGAGLVGDGASPGCFFDMIWGGMVVQRQV